MKIKVGIFFGGPSREREISFAGGRTVYDNLNKSLFEPIPIFVDSFKNFILLDWQYVYKGTIRDFYPPIHMVPPSPNQFQVYIESLGQVSTETQNEIIQQVGQPISIEELPNHINVAFLALHGEYGEDGEIQQQLDDLQIPYTGSGIEASKVGMDKALQKVLMSKKGFPTPSIITLPKEKWEESVYDEVFEKAQESIGFPIVVRPANQGSSIGVSIIEAQQGKPGLINAINSAFFREEIPVKAWLSRSLFDRKEEIRFLSDIRDGLGFPLTIEIEQLKEVIYHPEELMTFLNENSRTPEFANSSFWMYGHLTEEKVILESFIRGKEFSCIVIRKEDGSSIALPPTEIIKGSTFFDYRSKYMPGFSRKVTPIDLPIDQILAIRKECERLFGELDFQTYARIDGFINEAGEIFLNDPNTTSGMLPSSFFFHQAAEIGLNPSQFLTYIVRTSLQERLAEHPDRLAYKTLLDHLDESVEQLRTSSNKKKKVGVILGGYSFERHISVESGRNIFEKLSSSEAYEPIPIFLTGNSENLELYQLPINLLLKDNADDIRDKIHHFSISPVIDEIKENCKEITSKYASGDVIFTPKALTFDDLKEFVDLVFIGLHGRPGEDGQIQKALDLRGIPYNGSGAESSSITINKFRTLQILKRNGFSVAQQYVAEKADYEEDLVRFFDEIESNLFYPFIAKPIDDGCSSAVRVINNRDELEAYSSLMFRKDDSEGSEARKFLKLRPTEEFPIKKEILFESLITQGDATSFMEITGGLLTHHKTNGELVYEIFEPSEVLASDSILSLEEKFLAGEGQNITPARFAPDKKTYEIIASKVKQSLEKAARILKVQGYARIDAFVKIYDNHEVETIIIEVNSLPGMTPATVIFHQAALNKYKPYDLVNQILGFAMGQGSNKAPIIPTPITTEDTNADTIISNDQNNMESQEDVSLPHTMSSTSNNDPKEFSKEPDASKIETNPIKHFFQSIGAFFISKTFWRNLLGIAIFFFLFINLVSWALGRYTLHGKHKVVPELEGMHIKDAMKKVKENDLRIVISDSVFILNRRPNIIIEQTPKASSEVKRNRQIYVTITSSTAPMVTLPSLIGNYDYYQYTRKLKRLGVKYEIEKREFDRKLEENTILYFFHKGEKITDTKLRNNLKVPKGSVLRFVITEKSSGKAYLPNLVCKQFKEASFLLTNQNIQIGDVIGPMEDDAYIYEQDPPYKPGAIIDNTTKLNLKLTTERPAGCPEQVSPSDLIDTTENNN